MDIGKVSIEYLSNDRYPPDPALGFIKDLRENCQSVWRVESDGHLFMEIGRDQMNGLLDRYAGKQNLPPDSQKEIADWLSEMYDGEPALMLHTA